MNIIIANNFYCNEGGVEIYISSLGNLLQKFGHNVYFFVTDKRPYINENIQDIQFFPKYTDISSISLKNILSFLLNPFYFYNREAEKKMLNYIKKTKPDIIHLNSISRYLSPSIIKACKLNNIPTVMTIHDGFLACPDAALLMKSEFYCKSMPCIKGNVLHCIKNKCNDKNFFKSLVSAGEFFFRKIHKLYDKIDLFICPSQAIFDLALSAGIKSEKLRLIYNFVDDSVFNIETQKKNGDYFLFVGRLVKVKGLKYLLQAMKNLPDIQLKIIGTGPEESNLKDLAKQLNLYNVEFLGFKEGQELAESYKNCIATIIPSNYLEAFGLTIIESFCYGKPVIGSKIGGISEIIQNDVNGKLFQVGNVAELTMAIKNMYDNQHETKLLGEKAKEDAKKYNSSLYYSKLEDVYKQLLNMEANK